jgi:hypothetical protein
MPVEMKLRLFGGFYERLGSAERIVFEWNASNLGLTHERGLLHALSEAPGKQLDNLYELMNTPSMSEFSGRAGGYGSAFRPETRSRMLEIVRKAHPESRFSYNAMRARETMLGLRGLNSALPFLVYLGAARTDETEAQLIRGEELDVVFEEIDMANEPRVKEIVRETKGFSQPTDPRRT